MNPKLALSLLLILLTPVVGGCKAQPQAADAEFTLKTAMIQGRMVFVGVGGEIDGAVNPDLNVNAEEMVRVALVNGDGIPHDLALTDLNAHSAPALTEAQTTEVVFRASKAGEFVYYCTVAGHRQIGMEGKLIVTRR